MITIGAVLIWPSWAESEDDDHRMWARRFSECFLQDDPGLFDWAFMDEEIDHPLLNFLQPARWPIDQGHPAREVFDRVVMPIEDLTDEQIDSIKMAIISEEQGLVAYPGWPTDAERRTLKELLSAPDLRGNVKAVIFEWQPSDALLDKIVPVSS